MKFTVSEMQEILNHAGDWRKPESWSLDYHAYSRGLAEYIGYASYAAYNKAPIADVLNHIKAKIAAVERASPSISTRPTDLEK